MESLINRTPVPSPPVVDVEAPPAPDPPGIELDPDTGRVVAVRAKPVARFRPNEMDALKAETGKSLSQMQENEADGLRVIIWTTCRRAGLPVTWDEAGEIEVEFETPTVDPTSGGSSTSAPPSVTTSTSPPGTSTP